MNLTHLWLALAVMAGASASIAAEQEAHWERVANLNTPHQYHACVAVDGRIYAVGGDEKAAFEEYDATSNVWRLLPPMTAPRSLGAAAAVGRHIYAIGGLRGRDETLASVECYDLDRKIWERCPDLPTPRNRLSAVTVDEKILVIGGMDQPGG